VGGNPIRKEIRDVLADKGFFHMEWGSRAIEKSQTIVLKRGGCFTKGRGRERGRLEAEGRSGER